MTIGLISSAKIAVLPRCTDLDKCFYNRFSSLESLIAAIWSELFNRKKSATELNQSSSIFCVFESFVFAVKQIDLVIQAAKNFRNRPLFR